MADQSHPTSLDLHALLDRANDVVSTSITGRPRIDSDYTPKVTAKVRLDPDVVSWLKGLGPRHYSRINAILTALMEEQQKSESRQNEAESGH